MSYKIKSNPDGCVFGKPMHGKTCVERYYAQVRNNKWAGKEICWNNGECLVLDEGGEHGNQGAE